MDFIVCTYRSAKDVLGRVTFWYESFARNIEGPSQGPKPSPLKGKLLKAWIFTGSRGPYQQAFERFNERIEAKGQIADCIRHRLEKERFWKLIGFICTLYFVNSIFNAC